MKSLHPNTINMVAKTGKFLSIGILALAGLSLQSCSKDSSSATGWEYNNPKNGGYLKVDYSEQETGPGLVLIEGGTFTMGRTEQEIQYDCPAN